MKTSRFLTLIAVCCFCLTSVMNATPLHAQNTEDRKEVTNSVGMKLVQIPAGTFVMGSPTGEKDRSDDETQHPVTLSKPFSMGRTEVTQG
jgi:formylglycine-generating enzyme required for sulfatase activity